MSTDTPLLYPNTPASSINPPCYIASNPERPAPPAPSAFFSLLPTDQILALTGRRRLKRPDAMLLLALLAHKRSPDVTEVRPGQHRLAALLACCVRTVQRGLDRLEAAGLIVRRYQRDRRGRVHGLRYDLAHTLALLPPKAVSTKATKESPGPGGGGGTAPAPAAAQNGPDPAPAPKRHECRPELDSSVAGIDNSAPRPETSPLPPVVEKLIGVGVLGRLASRLFAQFGEGRCRQALDALARRKVDNPPAWLYRCLTENWDLTTALPTRPKAHRPYTPPAAPPPPAATDPLALLPPDRLAALERAARAQLIAETPVLRPIFDKGRRTPALLARMRALLPGGAGDLTLAGAGA